MRYPMITGHTGNDGTPYNSVESVEKSISLGADAFEVDVRRDENMTLVLSHDAKTQSIYDACPRLEDVMEIASHYPDIKINCDLKDAELPLEVINLAKCFGIGADRLILTGTITPSFLSCHPEIVDKATIYINAECILEDIYMQKTKLDSTQTQIQGYYDNPWKFLKSSFSCIDPYAGILAETCVKHGVKGINIPYAVLTGESINHFKKSGIPISVWTVDNKKDMTYLFSQGIENLTTRCVKMAKSVRKELLGY